MRILLVTLLFCVSLFGVENLTGKSFGELHVENELCPISQKNISELKDWLGFVQFNDGKVVAIASPKMAFRYFYTDALKNYHGIYKLYMSDYKTKKLIDSNEAFYVFGSRVMSIGGDDIIPFGTKEEADEFLKNNNGKKVFTIERIDKKFLEFLELR